MIRGLPKLNNNVININDVIINNDLDSFKKLNNVNVFSSNYLEFSIKHKKYDFIHHLISIGGFKHRIYNSLIVEAIFCDNDSDVIIKLIKHTSNINNDVFETFFVTEHDFFPHSILSSSIAKHNHSVFEFIYNNINSDLLKNKNINNKWNILLFSIFYNNSYVFNHLIKEDFPFFLDNEKKYDFVDFVFEKNVNFFDFIFDNKNILRNVEDLNYLYNKFKNRLEYEINDFIIIKLNLFLKKNNIEINI